MTAICFALAALLLLANPAQRLAQAQQASQPPAQSSSVTDAERQAGNNFSSSFASAEFAFDGRGLVQGAPFSAIGKKETTQILSGGRRLVRTMTARIFRDSQGRTRHDRAVNFDGSKDQLIPSILFDPTNGAITFLDPQHQRALRIINSFDGVAERKAEITTPQSLPDDITRAAGDRIEPLGTQVIEGVKAEGVRITSQIPAAQNGGQPGQVVYERWYSQELRRNILIKCTDPRFGEAVYRLTQIDRSEPARSLFEIPADYKIETNSFPRPARAVKTGYVK
ncbi:MAG TPA: hypothetical protein VGB17_13835 [Pyrinomonadaceae bacterium]